MTTTQTDAPAPGADAPPPVRWFAMAPGDVTGKLDTKLETGLSAAEVAARLQRDGPNALPVQLATCVVHSGS